MTIILAVIFSIVFILNVLSNLIICNSFHIIKTPVMNERLHRPEIFPVDQVTFCSRENKKGAAKPLKYIKVLMTLFYADKLNIK